AGFAREQTQRIGVCHSDAPRPRPRPARAAEPTVAVVIPCFNHGWFIREAIASVRSQTWTNRRMIVVDDGSTDRDTLRAMDEVEAEGRKRGDLVLVRRENGGLAAARNTGVRALDQEQAPFFVPLDADDAITPTFIER